MSPLRAGMCQGNFAASVKEILPIYQWGSSRQGFFRR